MTRWLPLIINRCRRIDLASWVLFALSCLANLILWYIWWRIHFSFTVMIFSTAVFALNIGLALLLFRKDHSFAWLLLAGALLIQIFTLVLLQYTYVNYL